MSLRTRASIVLLLGALLIPLVTSSLRGLTHVVSCKTDLSATFDAPLPDPGDQPEAVLLDPTAVTRGDSSENPVVTTATAPTASSTTSTSTPVRRRPVCGGINVDLTLSVPATGMVRIDVIVRNSGTFDWRGTLRLRVGTKVFPVELGAIAPDRTRSKSLEVDVDRAVQRVTGELLLGP